MREKTTKTKQTKNNNKRKRTKKTRCSSSMTEKDLGMSFSRLSVSFKSCVCVASVNVSGSNVLYTVLNGKRLVLEECLCACVFTV
jgi:hypothetical protein